MKTHKCLLAAPILALAAVLCVATATAGPPTQATVEKVIQADQYAIAPTNVMTLKMTDVAIAVTDAVWMNVTSAATPTETATSLSGSVSFEKGGAALCAEKLAVNGSASATSLTGTAGTTTSPPTNPATAYSISVTNSLDSSVSTAPSELVGNNTVGTCHVQSLAAAQNAAATELAGDTS